MLAGRGREGKGGVGVLPEPADQKVDRDLDDLAALQSHRLLAALTQAETKLAEDVAGLVDAQRELLAAG